MPSPAKLTNQALTFKVHDERETRSAPRSFFMSKPTMKQVEKDGLLLWQVSHGGMVRFFREDWKARGIMNRASGFRYYRTKVLGKGILEVPSGKLGVEFPECGPQLD